MSVHGALAHLPGTVLSFSQVNLLNSHESSGRWVPPVPFGQEKKLRGCTTHPGHPPGSASAGVSASQTLNRSTLLAGRALISINKMFSLRIPVSVLEASKCDWQIKVEFFTPRPQWHQTTLKAFPNLGPGDTTSTQRKAVNELCTAFLFHQLCFTEFLLSTSGAFFPLFFLFQLICIVIEFT